MVNAQEWLDENYPKEERDRIIKLDISKKNLTGFLNLGNFDNLEEFNCSKNPLTGLEVSNLPKLTSFSSCSCMINSLIFNNCPKLEVISISGNYLTSFDFNNLSTENLKRLHIDDNNFSKQDLTAFSKFFNLEELDLGTNNKKRITKDIYNRFCGSLEPLKNMKNLSNLDIRSTDIDSGLEYLPENLQKIHCDSLKENSACWRLEKELADYPFWKLEVSAYGYKYKAYNYQAWKKSHLARDLQEQQKKSLL